MKLPYASGKTYAVLGLGKTGRATIASLLESGARVIAWDDGEAARSAAAAEFASITLAPVSQWDYGNLAALVMSPGILLSHEAVRKAEASGVEVLGDIELLYRAQPEATYVAITGTNGKSTTTSLIAHILAACGKRVEVGGNLGIAALSLAPLGAGAYYVLELSSYQLELVRRTRFNTAVWLNISPDHLDHHGSMEHYIAAKQHIFDRQQPQDIAIIGIDDAASAAIARQLQHAQTQRVIPIAVTQHTPAGIDVKHAALHARLAAESEARADLSACRALQGEHNWQNAAAAYAACAVNGCAHADIMAAMHSYPGLPHRMQWLGEIAGVQYVNDSKATNADAAEKALKTYDNIYWILGGVAKEGGIEPLVPYFSKIRHAYLIGEAADSFAGILEGQVPWTRSGTLTNAVASAAADARKAAENNSAKPSVVLAPACASFDQFPNFEKRGDAFIALVNTLREGGDDAPSA